MDSKQIRDEPISLTCCHIIDIHMMIYVSIKNIDTTLQILFLYIIYERLKYWVLSKICVYT